MSKTVIGLMDNIGEAQNVVRDLVASGIERDDIGFMANEKQAPSTRPKSDAGADATSGALAGAGTGAAIGGVAGLALSLAPLAIPGIGPILAAGPIAAAPHALGVIMRIFLGHAELGQSTNQAAGERADAGAGQRGGNRTCRENRADARDRERRER